MATLDDGWTRIEFARGLVICGGDVEKHIKERYGISIRGRGFTLPSKQYKSGTLFCYVPTKCAAWVEYILLRDLQVPLINPIDPRNAATGKKIVPGRRRNGSRVQRRFIKSILRL